ncbi:MAG: glycine--tRNA ligase [Nanoarchaeota archaeon]|nr:glycine--tRNA ligase [Nanoarchaeota archaeon]
MTGKLSIDSMTAFCKSKGFVDANSEIYGGLAGFWDFGVNGVELKNNLKNLYWKDFVHKRDDVIGIDGTIITHPTVWEASGHVGGFGDALLECKKCNIRLRADHFIEDELKITVDGMSSKEIDEKIKEHNLKCPECGGEISEARHFSLMFSTQVGPVETTSSLAYLRPETAQVIFANFKKTSADARMKLPFGIMQTGKAFRNEIAPRNFLFRCREFEQMEIEYFVDPTKVKHCPHWDEVKDRKILVLSAKAQENDGESKEMTMKEMFDEGIVKSQWHCYWLIQINDWFVRYGVKQKNLRIREHVKDELSHYAAATMDIEYHFPFGWKELHGMADRTTFDLDQHTKFSGKNQGIFDEESKKAIIPHVIEPSQGVERAFLVFMFDAYNDDKERGNIVLKLHPKLAPYKVAVLPLTNKLDEKAREVYSFVNDEHNSFYDKSGSVGRRYARQDEIGTPFCVTVDFETLEDHSVTIRDRDSTKQIRVKVADLKDVIRKLVNGEIEFEKAGELIVK